MRQFLKQGILYDSIELPDFQVQNMPGSPQRDFQYQQNSHGLSYYGTPFKVYSYFIKQIVFIIDGIMDTLLFLPIRIVLHIVGKIFGFYRKTSIMQLKLDLIHLFLIVGVVLLLNCSKIFEIGLWYHNIRGQSQIKLYGIIQILDLIDRAACSQGDYIIRQLYYQSLNKKESIFNRYMLYSFIYLFIHSCVLGLSLTVYNVILSSGINLLYLALFVLSLIKLKGSLFKKQDVNSFNTMIVNDGRELFQKILYISIILFTVKFFPDEFATKIGFFLFADVLVDSFKYIQIVCFNDLSTQLTVASDQLSFYSFAVNNRGLILQNMAMIDQKQLNVVLQDIPQPPLKIIGKFQIIVFPYVILILKMVIYKAKKNYSDLERSDMIIMSAMIVSFSLLIKLITFSYQRFSSIESEIQFDLKKRKKN